MNEDTIERLTQKIIELEDEIERLKSVARDAHETAFDYVKDCLSGLLDNLTTHDEQEQWKSFERNNP